VILVDVLEKIFRGLFPDAIRTLDDLVGDTKRLSGTDRHFFLYI
jgi:hypothetical protein